MNKNKISPQLLKKVNILSKNKQKVLINCVDFSQTKNFLDKNKYKYHSYRFANVFCLDVDLDDLNILSNQNFISYISPNVNVFTTSKEQDFIHLSNLTMNKYYGQGVTICFIDTGVFPHFDFIFPHSRIVKFVDLINNSNQAYDDNGHGTFVCGVACGNGIISKENKGVAPFANIILIKALSSNGNSDSNVILDAMEWIYNNQHAYGIDIVCMSFGADNEGKIDALSNGVQALWDSGITVVAAAGNSGPNEKTIKSPGINPNIITVGALDIESLKVADFSSRGPTIFGSKPDLIAPAVEITSCNNKFLPYTKMSGTSVATPFVAGICAIIKSRYPNAKNYEIKKFLLNNCTKITGNKNIEGEGYINFKDLQN